MRPFIASQTNVKKLLKTIRFETHTLEAIPVTREFLHCLVRRTKVTRTKMKVNRN